MNAVKPPLQKFISALPQWIALACLIEATLVVWGWIAQIPILVQFHKSLAPMQFNTALCFLIVAALIEAIHSKRTRVARALTFVLPLFPLLTLVQDLGDYNFGIDQLFITPFITTGSPNAGRMAPNTALSFILISVASHMLAWHRKPTMAQVTSLISSAMIFALGTIAILGYLFNAVSAFGWHSYTQMALPTASLLVCVSIALILLDVRNTNFQTHRRVFLPILVLASAVCLTLLGWQAALQAEKTQFKEKARLHGESLREGIHNGLEERTKSLVRMVKRWEAQNGTPESLWRADALVYFNDNAGSAAVSYADEHTVVRWIEPLEGNQAALGFKLSSEAHRSFAISRAIATGKPAVSRVIELRQGGTGFAVFAPISSATGQSGFLILTFQHKEFFKNLTNLESYSISIREGERTLYELNPNAAPRSDFWNTELDLPLPGTTWTLSIAPSIVSLNNLSHPIASVVLGVGLLISLLIGILIYLYLIAQDANKKSVLLSRWNGAIVDGSQLAIISTDSAGLVKSFNPAAERLLELSALDAIDHETLDFWLDPEQLEANAKALTHQNGRFVQPGFEVLIAKAKLGDVYQDQWTMRTRLGAQKTVSLSVHALSDHVGRINGYVGIIEDITEKMKQEADLKEALKNAESATLAKSQFLANMSHEIRTPINGVMGMAGLLLDSNLTDAQRSQAESVETSAENLMVIINDILDLSKIEAGRLDLEEVEYNIEEVVRGVEVSLAYFAKKRGIALLKFLPNDLPRWFSGDPTRLRQILLNLVNNAIKFTSEGSVTISVQLQNVEHNLATLHFEVTDTGIGIPKEAQERIFQAFSQAESSTTRRFGGTGLGLSISKHLVHLMKGRIGVRSEPAQGSTFWFEIDALVFQRQAKVEPLFEAPQVSESLRILLVEDNTVNQVISKSMLQKFGHRVDIAANGLEALDALRDAPYHLILMDCQMPEMDGYEATRIIRKSTHSTFKDIPIIAMTANAMSGDREICLAAGMTDYVTKPIKAEGLASVIHKVLSRNKLSA